LKPVACDPANGLAYPGARVSVTLTQKAGADAETSSPKAMIGTATMGSRSGTPGQPAPGIAAMTVSVAADYRRPSAEHPDAVRIAFGGSGKFGGSEAIALREMRSPREGYYRAEFGPATVPLSHNGRTYPAGVRGVYYCYKDRSRAYFTFAVALQGMCLFGEKTRAVRFLDTTGNLRFDDTPQATSRSYTAQTGDVVLIDTGDGAFGGSVVRGYYGQGVCVDGAWYRVTISADGAKAVAEPVKVASGKLSVPAGDWEVVLVSGGKAMIVTGGRQPAAVPAGDYQVLYYREWSAPDKKGRRASFQAGLREWSSRKAMAVAVAEGRTTKLAIASPIKAQLTASGAGTSVRLGMSTPATSGGLSLMYITPADGWVFSQPAPPTLRILDAAGQLVDTVTLEYG
ncbi:MAG: hypothetical protein WBF17_27140, partial [Phycisphaerae bacterium]